MAPIKLTAKRQATFPVEVCVELGLRPGDSIELERREEAGGNVWVLRPTAKRPRTWLACLKPFAKPAKDHSMDAIRHSIAKGRTSQKSP